MTWTNPIIMRSSLLLTHYESLCLGQFFEQPLKFIKPLFVGGQGGLRGCQTRSLRVVRALVEDMGTLLRHYWDMMMQKRGDRQTEKWVRTISCEFEQTVNSIMSLLGFASESSSPTCMRWNMVWWSWPTRGQSKIYSNFFIIITLS